MRPAAAQVIAPDVDIRVTGRMLQDAEVRVSADATAAFLFALVEQPLAMPYLAVQRYPGDPASHRAVRAKAAVLRRGAAVVVYGRGLVPDRSMVGAHEHVLRFTGSADVQPLEASSPRQGAAA